MKIKNFTGKTRSKWTMAIIPMILLLSGITNLIIAAGSSPLNIAGYLDYSYGDGTVSGSPTGEKPESKLWWNDGIWWGSMFNPADSKYHIYRLEWSSQTWIDTGVVLDDRSNTRADVLWDGTSLYVASHVFSLISADDNLEANWARLYKYSYNSTTDSYSLVSGFPVTVNTDKTETLVLDKDISGRLWITYVSRDPSSANPNDAQIFVNSTTTPGNDAVWGTPLSLGDKYDVAHVSTDDISSLIAFNDKIGVMWSNQLTGKQKFYFVVHNNSDPVDTWPAQVEVVENGPYVANDHINLAKDNTGNIFAAVKTEVSPGIVLLARDITSSTWSYHELSEQNSSDTRPIVIVHETENKLYVFSTSSESGGLICYRDISIPADLADITYTPNNCQYRVTPLPTDPVVFMGDTVTYKNINNSTSTKQIVNSTTGLVVLASDNVAKVYVHNFIGNPSNTLDNKLFLPLITR